MIYITDEGDSIRVEGDELSQHFPYQGILTIPKNSLFLIVDDKSKMVCFKSISNNEVIFTAILGYLSIDGVIVTRDNIVDKFDKVANTVYKSSGGGGGNIDIDEILDNQSIIISMLESLTQDNNIINNMIDDINNETINCEYVDIQLIDEINNEIIC